MSHRNWRSPRRAPSTLTSDRGGAAVLAEARRNHWFMAVASSIRPAAWSI